MSTTIGASSCRLPSADRPRSCSAARFACRYTLRNTGKQSQGKQKLNVPRATWRQFPRHQHKRQESGDRERPLPSPCQSRRDQERESTHFRGPSGLSTDSWSNCRVSTPFVQETNNELIEEEHDENDGATATSNCTSKGSVSESDRRATVSLGSRSTSVGSRPEVSGARFGSPTMLSPPSGNICYDPVLTIAGRKAHVQEFIRIERQNQGQPNWRSVHMLGT